MKEGYTDEATSSVFLDLPKVFDQVDYEISLHQLNFDEVVDSSHLWFTFWEISLGFLL